MSHKDELQASITSGQAHAPGEQATPLQVATIHRALAAYYGTLAIETKPQPPEKSRTIPLQMSYDAPRQGIVCRAFAIARERSCHGMEDIRRQLVREGYLSVDSHLGGGSIRKQLMDLVRETRKCARTK